MDRTYVTASGVEVEFLPIPKAIQKFYETHSPPEPPFYETKTAAGATEKHAHDKTTLFVEGDPEKTAANEAAYAEYEKLQAAYNEKFLRLCFIKGIRVHAEMDGWLEEQRALELPVSEDLIERKIEWLTDYVVKTKEDYQAVMLGVLRATEAPEDLLQQIEGLFRGEMGQPDGDAAHGLDNSRDEQSMVLQLANGRGVDGVRIANQTEPV